jgi:hypothetical protein
LGTNSFAIRGVVLSQERRLITLVFILGHDGMHAPAQPRPFHTTKPPWAGLCPPRASPIKASQPAAPLRKTARSIRAGYGSASRADRRVSCLLWISRQSTTFRDPEMPCGMPGQVVHGFAGGIAGRRYRPPPVDFGKTATHRASKPAVLAACLVRSPLAHCNIRRPARKWLSKQFCSLFPPG